MRIFDKNIALVAKYFNVSPMDIMDGDYHYYMHQYNLAVEDEVNEERTESKKPKKTKRTESLFEAFGAGDIE